MVGCLGEMPARESCRLPLEESSSPRRPRQPRPPRGKQEVTPSSRQVDVDVVQGHDQVDQEEGQDVADHGLADLDVDRDRGTGRRPQRPGTRPRGSGWWLQRSRCIARDLVHKV